LNHLINNINKDIGDVPNSTRWNELQKKYNEVENEIIGLLNNKDSPEFQKCKAKLISLDFELDQLDMS
jgi:hypothetical protein